MARRWLVGRMLRGAALAAAGALVLGTDAAAQAVADFDGDGKTDAAVYDPLAGAWRWVRSTDGASEELPWPIGEARPVPGNYDGDGITDPAAFLPATGLWQLQQSDHGYREELWGQPGHLPVPGDYDGDGLTDVATYDSANGTWYVVKSKGGTIYGLQWGLPGDLPVPADYDFDGRVDFATFRPSNRTWYVARSACIADPDTAPADCQQGSIWYQVWGLAGDCPLPAHYVGDRRADYAIYRPGQPSQWWILENGSSPPQALVVELGEPGDRPVPGDYNGDGLWDVAVFRPSSGRTLVVFSLPGGGFSGQVEIALGGVGDQPLPGIAAVSCPASPTSTNAAQ